MQLVSSNDRAVLLDAGVGYTDREIAERRRSTAGAIRVRLSRLRLKLAA
jgi:DNA-directed RNA polymerase specialized sigma24 family protein